MVPLKAFNVKKYNNINAARIVVFGVSFGPAPWYGEDAYSGRMIKRGWFDGSIIYRSNPDQLINLTNQK
jgi:hypothetical protein